MYRSVHIEDFGSSMCNFFGNWDLDMVLNQLGFMGILLLLIFLGFWILAVWMPRKYSRLKLMYFLMNETNFKAS